MAQLIVSTTSIVRLTFSIGSVANEAHAVMVQGDPNPNVETNIGALNDFGGSTAEVLVILGPGTYALTHNDAGRQIYCRREAGTTSLRPTAADIIYSMP